MGSPEPPREPAAGLDPTGGAHSALEAGSREHRREQLVELYKEASGCTRCPLAATRQNVVFGAGNADAELMFVGEGPGANEDRQGLPFVGRAGELLNELLEGAGLARDEVFVANAVKCRPPGNRDPHPAELEACSGYLERQLELIQPRVVATLGNFATRLLTQSRDPISRVRGSPQLHTLAGRQVLVFPVFHPAAALRTPKLRESLQEDFAALRRLLDEQLPVADEPADDAEPAPLPDPDERRRTDQLGLFG